MDMTAMLPGNRSQAARARRDARVVAEAVRHPRVARRGAQAALGARGMKEALLHPRPGRRGVGALLAGKAGKQAALHPRAAARTGRALPLTSLAQTAWVVAGTPRRRTRSKATVAAGAVGVAGAGAAVAYAISRRSGNGQAPGISEEKPRVHTTPQEGHPAGTGTRSDRDIGGPTSEAPNQGATGGAPGTPPDSGFEPHT